MNALGADVPALVLFTRVPVAGRAKTRLLPALAAQGCADLQRAMVFDQVERLASLDLPLTVRYAHDAAGRTRDDACAQAFVAEATAVADSVRRGAPCRPVRFEPQCGDGLGERMAYALDAELAGGAPSAVLMGSDLPLVTAGLLMQALDEFERLRADVLLCPSEDGGYWCVGLRASFLELFGDEAYGGPDVFERALRICREHGRSVALGPVARDVDTPADLAWLACLARAADSRVGERTLRALEELGQLAGSPEAPGALASVPAGSLPQPRAPSA